MFGSTIQISNVIILKSKFKKKEEAGQLGDYIDSILKVRRIDESSHVSFRLCYNFNLVLDCNRMPDCIA